MSQKTIKKFKDYIKNISNKDRIAVIHHTDVDGLTSAVIVARSIEKLRGKPIELRLNPPKGEIGITKENLKELKKNKINKIFIVDLGVDETPGEFNRLKEFADILIIDHHPRGKNISNEKVIMIKADEFTKEPFQYPASLMCYDLFSKLVDINSIDWIAVLGIIGDCSYITQRKFVKKVFDKYKIKITKDIFKSKFGELSKGVDNSIIYNQNEIQKHFDKLMKAENYKNVRYLTKYNKLIGNEVQKWVKNFKKKAEHYPKLDLHIYLVSPKYKVTSAISTIISFANPKQTIIILSNIKNNNKTNVNLRRQDRKVKLDELAKFCIKDLKNSEAGGHIVASGARILKKDLKVFKKRIFEFLKKVNYSQ